MKRTAVIMAGGSGERFWPLSRMRKPKQLLKLVSDKTMLEESIDRISGIISPEDVFIITSRVLLEPIRNALPELPPENVIAEPYKRNTAPCLALAAAFIAEKYAGDYDPSAISIAVLTADQDIKPVDSFSKTVGAALEYVEKENALCTIGIPPSRPETGYGYIELEEPFSGDDSPGIKPVLRFREKPDAQTAAEYIETGRFLWNSGMFFWRLDNFIESMKKCLPDVGDKIMSMSVLYKKRTHIALPDALESVVSIFEAFPNTSIDYGLMEKAGNVTVAKALFSWDDIGSWDSLERIKTADDTGNIIEGETAIVDSHNSIIINNSDKKIIVAGLGLENMAVIATEDAFMVCPKDRVQEVKKCVEQIREDKNDKWL